jgi:hypothetical protein
MSYGFERSGLLLSPAIMVMDRDHTGIARAMVSLALEISCSLGRTQFKSVDAVEKRKFYEDLGFIKMPGKDNFVFDLIKDATPLIIIRKRDQDRSQRVQREVQLVR